ncbi:ATP-binding protein [Nonomuraea sp. ZG12]|uniref:ATP-binding protein n=1 Tax=Nonomuraea sp. ZG12 TaxID=3452207 RepID=UPI003F8CF25B
MNLLVQRLVTAMTGDRTGTVSWTFPPTAVSVRRARHQARTQLEQWGYGRHGEVVELLVSELVTNSLRHGQGQIQVTMSVEDGVLRCGVEDESDQPPRMRELSWDAERGRGMHLVDMLACCWGSESTRLGKVVWFRLAVRAGATCWQTAPGVC